MTILVNYISMTRFYQRVSASLLLTVMILLVYEQPSSHALTQLPHPTVQQQLKTKSINTKTETTVTPPVSKASSSVDIHPSLHIIQQAHTPKTINWLDQFPDFKKLLFNARDAINQFFRGLVDTLKNIVPDIKPIMGLSDAASKTVSIIVSALLGFIILLGLFFILRWWLAYLENKRPDKPTKLNKHFDNTLLINTTHHWRKAQQCARHGEFSEAIRQVYLSTLCMFDETKLLPFNESWTNIEYQQAMTYKQNMPRESKSIFSFLARQFECSRYGHHAPSEPDYNDVSKKYQELTQIIQTFQEQQKTLKKVQGRKQ